VGAEYGADPEVFLRILRFTAPFDFSGSPTITLPSGVDRLGIPLSLQFIGRQVSEDLLCRAGHASSKLRIGTPATRQICRKRSEGFFQRDRQIEINIIALSRKESMGID
jgi:hypothetical protein